MRQRLSVRISKKMVLEVAKEAMADEVMLGILYNFIYCGEEPLRWRAAWVVEQISMLYPSIVYSERRALMQLAMQSGISEGLLRLLLGVIYRLCDDEEINVAFFNFLLDKMCALKSSPGVQSLSIKLACRMSGADADLHREFLCVAQNMEFDCYSPAVKTTILKCLNTKRKIRYK